MMEGFTWKLTHTVKCTTEHNANVKRRRYKRNLKLRRADRPFERLVIFIDGGFNDCRKTVGF